eukprot:366278-Chlamydomonas_euryale.AAC.66
MVAQIVRQQQELADGHRQLHAPAEATGKAMQHVLRSMISLKYGQDKPVDHQLLAEVRPVWSWDGVALYVGWGRGGAPSGVWWWEEQGYELGLGWGNRRGRLLGRGTQPRAACPMSEAHACSRSP